jgi:hypothetical protein
MANVNPRDAVMLIVLFCALWGASLSVQIPIIERAVTAASCHM